jgi:hypothetical protein
MRESSIRLQTNAFRQSRAVGCNYMRQHVGSANSTSRASITLPPVGTSDVQGLQAELERRGTFPVVIGFPLCLPLSPTTLYLLSISSLVHSGRYQEIRPV